MTKVDLIYYNVTFTAIAKTQFEKDKVLLFASNARKNNYKMKDTINWLKNHEINYSMKFKWRKDYKISENLWNLYSYIRFRLEQKITEVRYETT